MKKLKDFPFLRYFSSNIKHVFYKNEKYRINHVDDLFYKWNNTPMSLTNINGRVLLSLSKETILNECEIDGSCISESVGLVMSPHDNEDYLIKTLEFTEISKKSSSFNIDNALKTITSMNLNTLHKSPYVFVINYFSGKITRCHEFDIPMANISQIINNSKKVKVPNSIIRYFLVNQNEDIIAIPGKCIGGRGNISDIGELTLSKDLSIWLYNTTNNSVDDLQDILFYESLKENIIIKRLVLYSLKDNKIEGKSYEIL